MDELRSAIDGCNWPRALVAALEAWRLSRAPELADLVDAIALRCTAPAPQLEHQRQWLDAAATYDPLAVHALCAMAGHRAYKADSGWGKTIDRFGKHDPVIERLQLGGNKPKAMSPLPGYQLNRVERLCAFVRWPDDPRVATVLAHWFARDCFAWRHPFARAAEAFVEILAEQLERLADARGIALLETCRDRPYGRTHSMREQQQVLAERVIAAIRARVQPHPEAAQIAAWTAELAPRTSATSTIDERELWRAVARDPDTEGPRIVLADYLLERGDSRGELIASPRARLLDAHWNEWMGPLALVLSRHSTFTHGVLDHAAIGLRGTPEWAWSAVGDHRELVTMRSLRSHRATGEQLATFVASLVEPLPAIALSAEQLLAFPNVRATWPFRHLELRTMVEVAWVDLAARLFPELERLDIDVYPFAVPMLVDLPRLVHVPRIVLELHTHSDADRATVAAIAATMPNVELRIS